MACGRQGAYQKGITLSRETEVWLNTMVLRGCTETHGMPWWDNEGIRISEGSEGNIYPHAIPMADVNEKLFNFEVIERPIFVPVACDITQAETLVDGVPTRFVKVDGRKAMIADDELSSDSTNVDAMGVFRSGFTGHPFKGLADAVEAVTDENLPVFSAGLLRKRAVGWVSFTLPETRTESDFEFYPFLTGSTSFDGTLATTFASHTGIVECDNTLDGANMTDRRIKVRHSRHSKLRLESARDALQILVQSGDETAKAVHDLSVWKISETEWVNLLNVLVPIPEDEDNKRGITVALNKRETLEDLYRTDPRCATWKGTALGVLQTFNTFGQHEQQVRGDAHRAERNMAAVLSGRAAKSDVSVLTALTAVAGSN